MARVESRPGVDRCFGQDVETRRDALCEQGANNVLSSANLLSDWQRFCNSIPRASMRLTRSVLVSKGACSSGTSLRGSLSRVSTRYEFRKHVSQADSVVARRPQARRPSCSAPPTGRGSAWVYSWQHGRPSTPPRTSRGHRLAHTCAYGRCFRVQLLGVGGRTDGPRVLGRRSGEGP